VKPLSNCVDVTRGLSYKGSGLSDGGVPMHNLNSIYEGGGYKQDGLKRYDGDYKPQHVARAGDLIVANTEQGHDRLLIAYAGIVRSLRSRKPLQPPYLPCPAQARLRSDC
jgi:type I restriction enzyme S subunit